MIIYFSCTGNTKWAAQQLAQMLGDRMVKMTDLITSETDIKLEPDEKLGFCFPVHGWRPPVIVRDFVSGIRVDTTRHHVYALCTAGDTIGETIDIFRNDLRQVGIRLDAAYSLIMPETYVGLPFMDVDKEEKERQKIQQAATKLRKCADSIARCEQTTSNLNIGRWPKINSRLIGHFFVRHLISDKPFRVDSRKCVKCGICANVCPVNDVKGGLGEEPTWLHNGTCLTCFACYHHCPHHAIEYGRQTKNKGQYFFTHYRKKPLF